MNELEHSESELGQFHSAWLGLHQLRRCVDGMAGLPCFILRQDRRSGAIDWWELVAPERQLQPFDFEFHFGLAEVRDQYHARNLARVVGTGRARTTRLFGFLDHYSLLAADDRHALFFYAGQFSREVPSAGRIRATWRALSRRDAVETDSSFLRWARTCLKVPVLAPEQRGGLREIGRVLARLATTGDAARAELELRRLRTSQLAAFATDHDWVSSALDPDGLTRPPWGLDAHLEPALARDLRAGARPTVVALIALEAERLPNGLVERQVAGRRLQHLTVGLCRQLPSFLAAPWGSDRVMCALGLGSQYRGALKRAQAFERAVGKVQRRLQDEHRLRTVAGLGGEVIPGEGLGRSYREASQAVAAAAEQKRRCLRYDPESPTPASLERTLLQRAERVVELVCSDQLDGARAAGRLLATSARPGAADPLLGSRPYLVWTLDRVSAELVRDHTLSADVGQRLVQEFENAAQHARDAAEVATSFEWHLGRLIDSRQRPHATDRQQRLERALGWLERHLDTDHPLEQTARRAGLAPGSFRRAFRRSRGQPFGTWLRRARINLARQLLCHGNLDLAQVASRTGFGTVHTLIRQFREHERVTPGEFRRRYLRGQLVP